jgi:hypothetical protein
MRKDGTITPSEIVKLKALRSSKRKVLRNQRKIAESPGNLESSTLYTQHLWSHWKRTGHKSDRADYDPEVAIRSFVNAAPESKSYDSTWKTLVESEVDSYLLPPHSPEAPFTPKEMLDALSFPSSKILTAPGEDELRNILLIEELGEAMLILMNFITLNLVRPSIWGVSRLIFIQKNIYTSNIDEMRPISLLSVLSKLFERLLPLSPFPETCQTKSIPFSILFQEKILNIRWSFSTSKKPAYMKVVADHPTGNCFFFSTSSKLTTLSGSKAYYIK